MAAECDKLAIVVGRTIVDNICDGRRSTDYFDQFITLIIHLCVQHDAREVTKVARRVVHLRQLILVLISAQLHVYR